MTHLSGEILFSLYRYLSHTLHILVFTRFIDSVGTVQTIPNDNVSMSVGHLDHVLTVYSSMEYVTWFHVCLAELVGSCVRFMHVGVFLVQCASFIHLVCRCASLSTTFALSQSTTWFSSTAWSVMADLWVTLLSLALEARVCVPAVKESTSFLRSYVFLVTHLDNTFSVV